MASTFKAGFARVDITPPLGSFVSGYYQDRFAKEILDKLEIDMVAFDDGTTRALVAQIDTMAISDYTAARMRDAIVKATGVEREAIFLHASHTHCGGQLAMASLDPVKAHEAQLEKWFELDRLYLEHCITRAADAAVMALGDLKAARLSSATTRAERISFARRYLMKDGKVRTNPGTNNPDIVKVLGTADDTVQVLRIDREGAEAIAIINFQTHPDVVGGERISADWPGLTRKVFESATLGKSKCLVLNGTQGDVNHCNVLPRPGELNGLKRDFDDVDRGYDHAWHMANVLAGAALSVWQKCAAMEVGPIRFAKGIVKVPAQKALPGDEKNLDWARRVWNVHEQEGDEQVSAKWGWSGMELTTEVARAGRILAMANHADYHELPLWALSMGDVAFGGFPGEPFNDIGVAVRKASPYKLTMLACIVNGYRGYFPFSDSYANGGCYESACSEFGPSVADDLIDGSLKLLNSIKN